MEIPENVIDTIIFLRNETNVIITDKKSVLRFLGNMPGSYAVSRAWIENATEKQFSDLITLAINKAHKQERFNDE